MKQIQNFLKLILALVFLSIFMACEGPEGPAGPKGDPGDPADPWVNWEGYAQGIKCADCHNPDVDTVYFLWGIRTQWGLSTHAAGGAYIENSSTCAPCHTTEGFIAANLGRPVTGHPISSPIGCFACHSPHSRANFSLRTTDPVTMLAGVEGDADYTFDYGKANLCASCHKPRSINPKPDPTKTAATDTITITSSRWYQHYGVQGLMLAGQNGFEFQGYTYPNSYHTGSAVIQEEGCGLCHMASEERTSAGGHTMWLESEEGELTAGCLTAGCHTEPFELDYNGTQTEIGGLLDSLHTLLFTGRNGRAWITASGSVNASTSNPLKIAPAFLAGVMYNYYLVEHDASMGVHNTKYARQLLESAIEVWNANP